jgi:hypothetical protein
MKYIALIVVVLALAATYQALIGSGDVSGIRDAVTEPGSTVTKALPTDMLRVANENGTIQQDERIDIYVTEDCAIVQAGRPPVELSL